MGRIVSLSRSVVLVGVVTVAIAGCERAPTAPVRVPTAPQFAAAFDNEWFPFTFRVFACTERVRVTGTAHFVSGFKVSASENEVDIFHVNAKGTGTGLTSGAEYRFNDVLNLMQQWRDGVRYVESGEETLRLTSDDASLNTKIRGHYKFTQNDNGEIVVEFDQTEMICE